MRHACIALVGTIAFAGTARAQWFTTGDFAGWSDAVPGTIEVFDFGGPFIGDIGQGPDGFELAPGVTLFADGPGVIRGTLGLNIGFDPDLTEFSLVFDTAVSALAWDHFNFAGQAGVTVDTGVVSYDIEILEGNGTPANTVGSVGFIEAGGTSIVTFSRADPSVDVQEGWFLDAPLQAVFVPAPGAAMAFGAVALAGLRRRRR
ncbi:MAG: hypothetical protein AAGH64_04250 [Planctomycetota bacterium]